MARFARCAALVATALLMAGCSGSSGDDDKSGDGSGPSASKPTVTTPGLPASLTSQKLDWNRCKATATGPAPGGEWRCATLRTPVDWAKPAGETMGLALIRSESSGSSGERVGSLLFNFGGPGGSGVDYLPPYGPTFAKLHERYDLVSWDPRGVAASEGVRCRGDKEIEAAEAVDTTPDTAAEQSTYLKDAVDFGKGCRKSAGKLMEHVSTTDTARDMDLMRHVLGDERLHYFGISYGTELGGVYAHLFPGRVGRLVLDAVVDPSAGMVGHAKNQAKGFQRALEDYLKAAGQNPEEGSRKIVDLLERIDAEPLPTSSGRVLTQQLALTGIVYPLYSKSSWPALTSALEAAQSGDGTELLVQADGYNDRDPSGRYGTTTHSQRVISCLDDKERPTAEEAKRLLPEFRKISPVFGESMGWDTAGWCHDWPVPGQFENPEVSAPGAEPILVVGNTGDPATPYEGARKMADELGKGVGVHLTWKGEGHGAYGSGSDCVDDTVDEYLLDGKVPDDNKVCAS
ncbi:alpha/beta hydrolase [Streptomyces fructofermentans]|uniref:Peptidase n=1 Tax=Streptomyces fructofermentans TaxID=152141 RepID=A0A918K0N7_9ACTN|nr:alpha/beta hydrolase [Streptomyces fructofermentans]GGX40546.1 peptidase [Streptomyces fructofermentans]